MYLIYNTKYNLKKGRFKIKSFKNPEPECYKCDAMKECKSTKKLCLFYTIKEVISELVQSNNIDLGNWD